MSTTTLAGILIALASLATLVARVITTGDIDIATLSITVPSLLAAFGLWKAADAPKESKP